jgi:hypothetical protein
VVRKLFPSLSAAGGWRSLCGGGLLACAAFGGLAGAVFAQAELPRGFAKRLPAYASGEERNRQTDLRVMEVQFKPMRMTWVELTNPKTGQKERKAVWYLVYRAITRPTPARADETDTRPINTVDPAPKPVDFMPEFTLTTYDDPKNPIPLEIHQDQVLPEVLAAIRAVEQRPAAAFANRGIENSLSVVQPFPTAIAEDAPAEDQDWIYGVATWTGVDPKTDYFQVTMRGFANAFELKPGPDGEMQPWRKVIVQKFASRGDEFDPNQREFEFDGEPNWEYQPDETQWKSWTPPAK